MSYPNNHDCEACSECLCPSCANTQCHELQCSKCQASRLHNGLTDTPIVCQDFINAKRPTLFAADDPLRVANC